MHCIERTEPLDEIYEVPVRECLTRSMNGEKDHTGLSGIHDDELEVG